MGFKTVLKEIYQWTPFKMEMYGALRKVWSPPESLYRHLHFKGVFKVNIDSTRSFKIKHYGFLIENEIFWTGLTGNWEKESIKLWMRLCENASVIFDLGANTGIYSLVAKGVNPASKVYAFEPVTRVFNKLCENIKINEFDIVAVEKAVSNADGTALIRDTNTEHTYSVTVNTEKTPGDGRDIETIIPIVKLNTFIRENNIRGIDLMKIDVESHEPEVLEGFSEFLFQFRPIILIEVLYVEIAERINAIMKDSDYLFFYVDESDGVKQVDKIKVNSSYNFLMCPPEKVAMNKLIQDSITSS